MPQIKSTQSSLSDINMVPFIDVVLVLLIIFMITAPILQSGIEVDVPKTHTVKEITEQRLVVTVDKTSASISATIPSTSTISPTKLKNSSKSQRRHLPPLRRDRSLRRLRQRHRLSSPVRRLQHQHRHATHHRSRADSSIYRLAFLTPHGHRLKPFFKYSVFFTLGSPFSFFSVSTSSATPFPGAASVAAIPA